MRQIILLLSLVLGLGACSPAATIAWRQLGGDAIGCFAPGTKAALSGALDGAIKEATGVGVNWEAYGKNLAASYGGAVALCLVQSALARLGPVALGSVPDGDPRIIFYKLDKNRDAWLK